MELDGGKLAPVSPHACWRRSRSEAYKVDMPTTTAGALTSIPACYNKYTGQLRHAIFLAISVVAGIIGRLNRLAWTVCLHAWDRCNTFVECRG